MKREEGYYWVEIYAGKWIVALWRGELLQWSAGFESFNDKCFVSIGNLIPSNEQLDKLLSAHP